jgi:hypothetical protein
MRGCRHCLALVLLAGCGDNTQVTLDDAPVVVDVPPSGPCWFDPPYNPAGSIVLGTGSMTFEPMPDMPNLEPPGQQVPSYDLAVNAQMTGLEPGNPIDPLDPHNPRTRFRGVFVDTGASIYPALGPCGVRVAYSPASGATFELSRGTPLVFDPALTGTDLFGREVRVTVEIIDANMHYAIDEKVVTLQPPPQSLWQ